MKTIKSKLQILRGELIGVILGYFVSYFLQSEIVRAKLGLGGYFQHIWDVLTAFGERGGNEVALTAWITMFVGALVGGLVETILVKKGLVDPWPPMKDDKESES